MPAQHNKTEDDITAEVLQRFAETPDPRLRQIMLGLVKHLPVLGHARRLDGRRSD